MSTPIRQAFYDSCVEVVELCEELDSVGREDKALGLAVAADLLTSAGFLFDVSDEAFENTTKLLQELMQQTKESVAPTEAVASFAGVTVTVTRSADSDRAPLVLVDTDAEKVQDGEKGPQMRILLNDDPVFVGKEYEPVEEDGHA